MSCFAAVQGLERLCGGPYEDERKMAISNVALRGAWEEEDEDSTESDAEGVDSALAPAPTSPTTVAAVTSALAVGISASDRAALLAELELLRAECGEDIEGDGEGAELLAEIRELEALVATAKVDDNAAAAARCPTFCWPP